MEMGRYSAVCSGLEVAAWEQDVAWTEQLMGEILSSVETIGDFAKSDLYRHMAVKPVEPGFSASVTQALVKSFGEETFSYMQGNAYWEALKSRGK